MTLRTEGAGMIAAERLRQIEKERFDARHDDDHDEGELAWAAVCYAAPAPVFVFDDRDDPEVLQFVDPWPTSWDAGWDKRPRAAPVAGRRQGQPIPAHKLEVSTKGTARRIGLLVKAGALIAAEIDRLVRLQQLRASK